MKITKKIAGLPRWPLKNYHDQWTQRLPSPGGTWVIRSYSWVNPIVTGLLRLNLKEV